MKAKEEPEPSRTPYDFAEAAKSQVPPDVRQRDDMRKWIINSIYVVISTVLTLGIGIGAWLTFFVNPINWKNYIDYHAIDYVIAWGSNALILIVALELITLTWGGLWKLKKKMANKRLEAYAVKLPEL